jgi:hypothetical protein
VPASTRRRRALSRLLVLGLYAIVAIATPMLHHDIGCHLESKGHCDACTSASKASRVEAEIVLAASIARVPHDVVGPESRVEERRRATTPGRAPPSPHRLS